MNYQALIHHPIPVVRQSYGPKDAVLYALSVSGGFWADSTQGLDTLIDTRGPVVLPSFAVDLGHPGFWLGNPATTVDATRVVHAEESFRLDGPLPAAASVVGSTCFVDLVDKGPGKGALLYLRKDVTDAATGRLIAQIDRTIMLRGDGGYDGPSGLARSTPQFPDTAPDHVIMVPTHPEQAFLYRLNGDPNPLHVEPEVARAAGFERPILHGLCTFGIASTAAFHVLAASNAARFRGFRARFSAPVYPGESLRIELWNTGAVRVLAAKRGIAVLSHGQADIVPV